VPLCEPLEVEVVEDIAVDDKLTTMIDRPDQEILEQPGLANVAAQMKVADDDAIVHRLIFKRGGVRIGLHQAAPAATTGPAGRFDSSEPPAAALRRSERYTFYYRRDPRIFGVRGQEDLVKVSAGSPAQTRSWE
jgi:hypothetical protein